MKNILIKQDFDKNRKNTEGLERYFTIRKGEKKANNQENMISLAAN